MLCILLWALCVYKDGLGGDAFMHFRGVFPDFPSILHGSPFSFIFHISMFFLWFMLYFLHLFMEFHGFSMDFSSRSTHFLEVS